MATIVELPYELLYQIILLLGCSSVFAIDLARIFSVCRAFRLYSEDARLLKVARFDGEIDIKTYHTYQDVNGLLVKCSIFGNISAQFLLGKVILLSSHLPCGYVSPSDLAKPGQVLATDLNTQRTKDRIFVNYFRPYEVSLETRLVHSQLVKVFLENGSHHDIIEMMPYLKSYISYVTRNDERKILLLYFKLLEKSASRLKNMEKRGETEDHYRNQAYKNYTNDRYMSIQYFEQIF